MVKALIATMLMSASMAVACPTCGCQDAASKNANTKAATKTVSDEKACTGECSGPAEACCSKTDAATMTVAAPAEGASSCGADCPMTGAAGGAAVMAVSDESCSATCASASSCESACETACDGAASATSFVAYMPKMTYKVGNESMTCSKMAGSKAAEQKTHMHFVVAGHEYDDQAEAMVAHGKQLETMMMDLVRIQYAVNGECVACPTEAHAKADSCETQRLQYRVGPATFDSAEDAIKASIMAYNAAQNVKMEYAVGEDTTTCSTSAGMMAKEANCKVEYVVNGKRTNCSKSAAYMKTLASVESALKALEAASKAPVTLGA